MADTSKRGLASADEVTRERVAHEGGAARREEGADYAEMGQKGGHAAQASGHAHKLTEEERSEGGSRSGGNFRNDSIRASEVGHIGGSH